MPRQPSFGCQVFGGFFGFTTRAGSIYGGNGSPFHDSNPCATSSKPKGSSTKKNYGMVAFSKKIYKNQSRCLFVSFCIYSFSCCFFSFRMLFTGFFWFALDGDEINWYAFNGRLGSFRGRWVPDIPNSHRDHGFPNSQKQHLHGIRWGTTGKLVDLSTFFDVQGLSVSIRPICCSSFSLDLGANK